MCRSIKKLRIPEGLPTEQEMREAALQYVRKVSGFRKPSGANQLIFEKAVAAITAVTEELLANLVVRGQSSKIPSLKETR